MTPAVARVAETFAAIAGAAFALAPSALLLIAPWSTWLRGVVLLALGFVSGLIWLKVDWPSGWGGWRDFFCFGMMLSVAAGALTLLWAAGAAILS